ncbi:MAG: DEAD/DEAH box helicase family protein [Cetobacterium sp.]|uniref:DEAD/DEAH box helicase family protein n=1 Tax=Cetobacterium sp. TaxID=2071632 RepID=UPI003F2A4AC8
MDLFEKLDLKTSYRSDEDNIYCDFLEKCLKNSISYDRAVGYFTSDSLYLLLEGVENLIRNNGKMRVVTSPQLSEKDVLAIKNLNSIEIINLKIEKELEKFYSGEEEDITKIFSWLISKNLLQLKIAYQKDQVGIYHEKFGIFKDIEGNKIAFSGSVNETIGGMSRNFESIDVYFSLDGKKDLERIENKERDFEKLWENKTNKIEVIDIDEAIKKNIISKAPTDEEIKVIFNKKFEKNKLNGLVKPEWFSVREYQKDALESWKDNHLKGILEMATGSGKTLTALNIMTEISKEKRMFFVVVCPQTFLVRQWAEEIKAFGVNSIICNSENKNWKAQINAKIFLLNEDEVDVTVAVVTNKTLQNIFFLRALKRVKKEMMIVVDECHNIGSSSFENFLEKDELKKISIRLGLSATPDRQGDQKGNEVIEKYLGKVVFQFSLDEAIKGGFLTNYKYFPYFVTLTEEEEREYIELSKKIASLSFSKNSNLKDKKKESTPLEMLLFKRARLLNLTNNKILKLLEAIDEFSFNNLIYVGAGKSKEESEDREQKFIDKTIETVSEKLDFRLMKFTSEESKDERKVVIQKFKEKEINAVVAIKCLDEGINIPSIQRAYILGSTSNYREYVQRRGRILRKSENKSIAEIHDFIIIPRSYESYQPIQDCNFNFEKKLVENELKRLEEYNSLALNKNRNESELRKIKEFYRIGVRIE